MNTHVLHKDAVSAADFKNLRISSAAFTDSEFIPSKYTCDGENISPPIDIEHIPENAKSLVLIMDDPDAPSGTWVHWIVWNIPVTHHLKENNKQGTEGVNSFHKHNYGGPCPPGGTHRYFFKVYALSDLLDLPDTAAKHELEVAMSSHILAFGELIGLYKRK